MKYKIIVDSCCDFPEDFDDKAITKIALYLHVDDEVIIDDETFDQLAFIDKVRKSKESPKSACPSPQDYMKTFEGEEDNIFIVTLSKNLSASYNSAEVAKKLYLEEQGSHKNIYVFNSRSASSGETLIALKLKELAESGLSFDEIVEKVEDYIQQMDTYFVIESLETLQKNGRISNLQALVATVLNIKPVMGATAEGSIHKLDQARGIEKALKKMVDHIIEKTKNPESKVLAIAYCNCLDRALYVKDLLLRRVHFKEIILACTGGVSTLYANDGGIIIAV